MTPPKNKKRSSNGQEKINDRGERTAKRRRTDGKTTAKKSPGEKAKPQSKHHPSRSNDCSDVFLPPKKRIRGNRGSRVYPKMAIKKTSPAPIVPKDAAKEPTIQLAWESASVPVPLEDEEEMLKLVYAGRKERGMMRAQPQDRIESIRNHCQRLGITIRQACSLRRHRITGKLKGLTSQQLGLGTDKNISIAAGLFEDCIESYLSDRNVPFYTETEQRKSQKGKQQRPTPDFLLREPVELRVQGAKEGVTINFIEVKMFYGASTIIQNNKSAVGKLLHTAQKYHDMFGPGAFVFAHGCGANLATQMEQIGVSVLDAACIDTSNLDKQMRTWCATKQGDILP